MRLPLLLAALVAAPSALAQDPEAGEALAQPAYEDDPPIRITLAPATSVEEDVADPVASSELEAGAEADEATDAAPDGEGEATGRRRRRRATGGVGAGERLQLDFGGMVQYDLCFRPIKYHYGTWYNRVPSPALLDRNELIGRMKLNARYGRFGMKSNVDLVLRAYPNVSELGDLVEYNKVSPFRVEAHELYLFAQGNQLDLRIGQQKVMFGVGDQFNPTNNINANDFEDVLLFGDQIGNLMVRLDWTPAWNWTVTGILVPIMKPALLPRTGYLAQTPDRYPSTDEQTRWALATEQALGAGQLPGAPTFEAYPTIVRNVAVRIPEFSPENMQQFFRVGTTLGGQDIALSYYRGFSDIPQAVRTDTYQDRTKRCFHESDLGLPANQRIGPCIDGTLQNDVTLTYPRMQVLGLNMTGEFNAFKWLHKSFKSLGYRIEAAVVFPEKVRMDVVQHDVRFDAGPLGTITADGKYAYRDGADGSVVDGRPFAKWVLGLDYTFNKHVYMNTQWVHGFPDEFGAGDWIQPGWTVRGSGLAEGASFGDCVQLDFSSGSVERKVDGTRCAKEYLKPRLGDYLVVGLDFKFAAQRGLIRIFTIWDLIGVYESTFDPTSGERVTIHHGMFSKDGFSAVIYPDLRWNFGNGFELHAGALVQLGKPWTKFGAPENGGHQIWTRARYSF